MGQIHNFRSDGWTAERQLRFLEALAHTGNVRKAAASAGMSREGAYRLRERSGSALFAALWDLALAPQSHRAESHTAQLTDGRLVRLLRAHFRRECGDYDCIGGNAK
jgi:molybdenum-dependent DNA-binding transcriptional regulator ModE